MPDRVPSPPRTPPPPVNPRSRVDVAAVRVALRRTGGRLKKRAPLPRLRQTG